MALFDNATHRLLIEKSCVVFHTFCFILTNWFIIVKSKRQVGVCSCQGMKSPSQQMASVAQNTGRESKIFWPHNDPIGQSKFLCNGSVQSE